MAPPIHVIVKLPYNRPADAPQEPIKVEWTQDKENMLWEVIAKSRATEGSATDWQGLSHHLQVPLPYLLFRAQARYEEDLRGIQDLRGTLGPQAQNKAADNRHQLDERLSSRGNRSNTPRSAGLITLESGRLGSSTRSPTLRQDSQGRPLIRRGSSQTIKVAFSRRVPTGNSELRHQPPLSSDDESGDEDEPADRREAEQDDIGQRLKELEQMMSRDTLGLVRKQPSTPSRSASVGSEPKSVASRNQRSLTLTGDAQFDSPSVSPHGSIPSIPSPQSGSQSSSQVLSPRKQWRASTSPARSPLPSLSRGQPQVRNLDRTRAAEKGSSTQGSTTSSFSDISEADVSASALESALMSNIRGGGSRLSVFGRGRFGSPSFRGVGPAG